MIEHKNILIQQAKVQPVCTLVTVLYTVVAQRFFKLEH
jgi:hypothetical protein